MPCLSPIFTLSGTTSTIHIINFTYSAKGETRKAITMIENTSTIKLRLISHLTTLILFVEIQFLNTITKETSVCFAYDYYGVISIVRNLY